MPRKDPERCKAYQKAYYATHKVTINRTIKRCQQKTRFDVLEHYSYGCLCCAHCKEQDIDVLCIDHIDDNGAEERRELPVGIGFYQWLKKNGYPKGYQVLCRNCNWKKRLRGGSKWTDTKSP